MTSKQIILITGASSGIGLETATLLAERGHRVFGTSRNPSAKPYPFTLLQLDITDQNSVETCVSRVIQQAGKIDVLINNAGYHLYGTAEETSVAETQAQFDTNFLGAVRMIKAVLAGMRQQQDGKIINMSSIGGFMGLPYTAAYTASKYALEGYSESLRYELLPLNIYVSLIQPPGVKTGTQDTSVRIAKKIDMNHDAARVADFRAGLLQGAVPMRTISHTILQIVNQSTPHLHYPVGSLTRSVQVMKRLMPEALFEWFIRRQYPVAI
jgi:short-subunit dehydrogenase